jgi:hypothetical protein
MSIFVFSFYLWLIYVIELCALDDTSWQLQVCDAVDGAAAAERRTCATAWSSARLHGGTDLFLMFRFL